MDNQTYINGTLIDCEAANVAFTYSISDIREPQSRVSDFSKTITIAGTKTVNKLFSHIYQIDKRILSTNFSTNFSPDFNPNLKADFLFVQDGIEIFKGYVQLVNIVVTDKVKIDYEVICFGRFNNLFVSIGEKNLDNIDLSAYDHVYNVTNQAASWIAAVGSGYVYPLIDYGFPEFNGIDFRMDRLYPAVYVKTYVDKIFSDAGYTYTSDFLTSNRFKKFIIPTNKKTLSVSSAQLRATSGKVLNGLTPANVEATLRDTPLVLSYSSLNNKVDFQYSEYEQPEVIYNGIASPKGITILKTGTYRIDTSLTFEVNLVPDVTTNYSSVTGGITILIKLVKNGSTIDSLSTSYTAGQIISYDNSDGTYTFPSTTYSYSASLVLNNDDDLWIEYDITTTAILSGGVNPPTDYVNYNLFIDSDSDLFATRVSTAITEGDTLKMNDCIPTGVKQKDFLSSIFRHFNLYADIDKTNSTNLIIKPRDDYYSSTVVDWTNKVDYNFPIEEIPMGELNAKRYVYKYKDDNDYFNKAYKDRTLEPYGQIEKQIANDFLKDTATNELIYSTKPMSSPSLSDMNYPVFSDKHHSDTTRSHIDANITMLFYGGTFDTNVNWQHVQANGITYTSYSYYPYCGHLDDPYAPTFDLLMGAPLELYYTTTTYTSNNCFNIYHKKQFTEISDINSKLIKLHVALNPIDIYNLDFSKLYMIDGNYFRLNKVIDYTTDQSKSTKVELFKSLDFPTFTGSTITVPPAVTSYNLVQGGENEIRDIGAASFYNLVQGGQDEVRDIGASSVINLINGGKNAV